jgi:hypothetical protein
LEGVALCTEGATKGVSAVREKKFVITDIHLVHELIDKLRTLWVAVIGPEAMQQSDGLAVDHPKGISVLTCFPRVEGQGKSSKFSRLVLDQLESIGIDFEVIKDAPKVCRYS